MPTVCCFNGQTSVFDAVLQIKEQVPDGAEIATLRASLKEQI